MERTPPIAARSSTGGLRPGPEFHTVTVNWIARRRKRPTSSSPVTAEIGLDELRLIVAGRGQGGAERSDEATIAMSATVADAPAKTDGPAKSVVPAESKVADIKPVSPVDSGKPGIGLKIAEGGVSYTQKVAGDYNSSIDLQHVQGQTIKAKLGAGNGGLEASAFASSTVKTQHDTGSGKIGTTTGITLDGTANANAGVEYKDGKLVAKAEMGAKVDNWIGFKGKLTDANGSTTLEGGNQLGATGKVWAGIENATLKAYAKIGGTQELEVAAKRSTTVGSAEVTQGASAMLGAVTASAAAEATLGLQGLKAAAGADADFKQTVHVKGSVKNGDQDLSGKAHITGVAHAAANAQLVAGTDGLKAGAGAHAGVALKAGAEGTYAEGQNFVGGAANAEFGAKVGAGASAGVTVKNGVAMIDVTVKGTLVVGFEVKLKAGYDTKSMQLAATKALEAVARELGEYSTKSARTVDGHVDLTADRIKATSKFIEKYGEHLAEEGRKQDGLFGAINVVKGEAAREAGFVGKELVRGYVDVAGEAAKQGHGVSQAVEQSELTKDTKKALKPVVDFAGKQLEKTIDAAKVIGQTISEKVVQPVGSLVVKVVQPAADLAAKTAVYVGDKIVKQTGEAIKQVGDFVGKVVEAAKAKFKQTVDAVDGPGKVINDTLVKPVGDVVAKISEKLKPVSDFAAKTVVYVGDKLAEVGKAVKNDHVLKHAYDKTVNDVRTVVSAAVTKVADAGKSAVTFVGETTKSFVNVVSNVWSWAKNWFMRR